MAIVHSVCGFSPTIIKILPKEECIILKGQLETVFSVSLIIFLIVFFYNALQVKCLQFSSKRS